MGYKAVDEEWQVTASLLALGKLSLQQLVPLGSDHGKVSLRWLETGILFPVTLPGSTRNTHAFFVSTIWEHRPFVMQPSPLDDLSGRLVTVLCFRALILPGMEPLGPSFSFGQRLSVIRSSKKQGVISIHGISGETSFPPKYSTLRRQEAVKILRAFEGRNCARLVCVGPALGAVQSRGLMNVGRIQMKRCQFKWNAGCESVLGVSSFRWSIWSHKNINSS